MGYEINILGNPKLIFEQALSFTLPNCQQGKKCSYYALNMHQNKVLMVIRFCCLLKGDFPIFDLFPSRGMLVGTGCIEASVATQDIA